jgi:hypothetical protein
MSSFKSQACLSPGSSGQIYVGQSVEFLKWIVLPYGPVSFELKIIQT